MDIATRIQDHIDADTAAAHLQRYLTPGAFSGAHFETIGGPGDTEGVADRFTAADLVAVTMLNVRVPGWAAIRLLKLEDERFNGLLAAVPHQPLHEVAKEDLQPLWDLQDELDQLDGIGHVTRSKLLARKRPHLVPIRDQHVLTALTGRDYGPLTLPLRDALHQDSAIVERLQELRDDVEGAQQLSLLRVLDIVVWMDAHGAASVTD